MAKAAIWNPVILKTRVLISKSLRNIRTTVSGSIIYKDNLKIGKGLVLKRIQAFLKVEFYVIYWHYNTELCHYSPFGDRYYFRIIIGEE